MPPRTRTSGTPAAVDAARHWAARPARYRLNVLVVDCCRCACATATPTSCMATSACAAATPTSAVATPTCTGATPTSGMVALARDANAGRVRRQVALTHAGTPLSDHSATLGLRAVFACPSVLFAYAVTSRDEGHVTHSKQVNIGLQLASPLRELRCHMRSHGVTCHPTEVTFPFLRYRSWYSTLRHSGMNARLSWPKRTRVTWWRGTS